MRTQYDLVSRDTAVQLQSYPDQFAVSVGAEKKSTSSARPELLTPTVDLLYCTAISSTVNSFELTIQFEKCS